MPDKNRRPSLPTRTGVKSKAAQVSRTSLPPDYIHFLEELKARIQNARIKASLSVNRELILLYWTIGRDIIQKQQTQGWGAKVIDHLAADLQKAFPGISGLSRTNVYRMRAFFLAYSGINSIIPQPVGQISGTSIPQAVGQTEQDGAPQPLMEIPWGQNIILIERIKDPFIRLWYAKMVVEHGWSRAVLDHQIELGLYERQGKAVTNFERTLPLPQSDLAQQALKDPYVFDFLSLSDDAAERELERGLIEHIRKFMLELGVGFAFVGSQYHLEVEGDDFYIDLLFYHLRLRCFVVIDLKMGPFKPEFAGKMNFYLSAVDELLRYPTDNPSIGIILCKTKKKLIAEYALRNTMTPIGVSEYTLTRIIPSEYKPNLPSIEDLEKELGDGE